MNFYYASIQIVSLKQVFTSLQPATEYQQDFLSSIFNKAANKEVKYCHVEIMCPEQCLGGCTNVTFLAKR